MPEVKRAILGPAQFERCGKLGMTQAEIGALFGVSQPRVSALLKKRENREAFERGKAAMTAKLRSWQIEAAEGKNPALLIWLGKQYLGQKDAPHQVDIDQRVSVRYIAEWGRDNDEIEGGTQEVLEAGEEDVWEEEE